MRAARLLFGIQLKRDVWLLTVWILGIALLCFAVGAAINDQFAEEAERAAIVALASSNPAFLFLRGLPDGTSVGAVAFFQSFSFTAVLAALMNTFLVVRHTRADEELGRAELLESTPVSRSARLVATLALAIVANVVLSGAVALGLTLGGLPGGGAIVTGLAVGCTGLLFAGIAAIIAQAVPSGRASNGLAAAAVGGAYLIRGIGDALGTPSATLTSVTPSWVSWLSPIGWGQATHPFTEPTLSPLLLGLGCFGLLAVAAVVWRRRRDLGSSVLPDRRGADGARPGGRSVLGLAWRLQRATLAGWGVGVLILGSIAGGLAPAVADAVESNPSLSELINTLVPGSSADTVDVFTAALLGIAGVLAGAAGVQAVLRLRAEESEGRAELLLASPVSRPRWMTATLIVAAVSVLAVCALAGLSTGAAMARSTGDPAEIIRFLGAALGHAPAALVFVSLAAVIFAITPRITVALGWGLLTLGLILGQFGELLRIPEWVQGISPFFYSPAAPVEPLDVTAMIVLSSIAIGIAIIATRAYRKRDMAS